MRATGPVDRPRWKTAVTDPDAVSGLTLGVLGGTGPQGRGLA